MKIAPSGEAVMAANWMPASWRSRRASQLPEYPDPEALAKVELQLSRYPPLVFAGEAKRLKERLADVARIREWYRSVSNGKNHDA